MKHCTTTWIPQPQDWGALTVAAQDGTPGSTLELYRTAIALRRARGLDRSESFAWTGDDGPVLGFVRDGIRVLANTGTADVEIDESGGILSSAARPHGILPRDTAVWLERAE